MVTILKDTPANKMSCNPYMGKPDIVRISGDGEYESQLAQARALQDNPHIFGALAPAPGQDAEERVKAMAQGVQFPGYNNRQQTYRA